MADVLDSLLGSALFFCCSTVLASASCDTDDNDNGLHDLHGLALLPRYSSSTLLVSPMAVLP